MSNKRPLLEEQYRKNNDIINYVIYKSTTGFGNDEVLQHKIMGVETAHITLHPDGNVNFRIKHGKNHLESAIRTRMLGFSPPLSENVDKFILKVRQKI